LYPLAQSVYSTRHPPEFKVSPTLCAAAGGELLPHRSHLVRLATIVAACFLVPVALSAQRDSSARTLPAAAPRLGLVLPPELQPFGILSAERPDAERVARTWAQQLDQRLSLATRRALFGAPIAPADATGVLRGGVIPRPASPSDTPSPVAVAPGSSSAVADTTRHALSGLDVDLQTRIEGRGERFVDHRCVPGAANAAIPGCRSSFSPNLNVQFALKSAGSVAERFHVNVDFDSQREFDASNHLQVWYEGKPGSSIRRVELGNVAFATPSSRFLGAAVPAGNYGLQAEAMLGRVKVQAIAAQQKGNVVRERQFMVGDERTLQSGDREIEDWQIEPRRFFFAIDPRQIRGYPAIDILDRAQMTAARAALPEAMRPTRLQVYRLQFGATPQNPNGPRLRVQEEGQRTALEPQTYDVLREGVDYYVDPSLLWFALIRPINQANERLLVAYNVRIEGRDTIAVATGGTPDVERRTDREQIANLVWDPNVTPDSRSFPREIRSVYRIGGSDLVRERTQLRVVAGAGNQEKPLAGSAETYLQMFGLSQPTNSAEFDVEQRLWPRRGDPVFNLGAGAGVGGQEAPRILTDHFLVLPSLQPFAPSAVGGLVEQGNPSNEAIYTTPGEYLAFGSPRHPASIYRLVLRYDVEGSPDRGSLMLGGVALRRASERISVDGVTLARDIDYRIDYELGRVTFLRPDTLFDRPRNVGVRYEENPIFAATPTRLAGVTSQWAFPRGQLALTAVSQSQASAFTRPQLGFERAASTMAGLTGNYSLPLAPLTRALSRLPWGATSAPSRLDIQGELALSRPQSLDRAQAYLESFEGEGGVQIGLLETSWQLSSMPAYGVREVRNRYLGQLEPDRAAPLIWQSAATQDGGALRFGIADIDPHVQLSGVSSFNETVLWLTLHSHRCGALDSDGRCSWPQPDGPRGTRWRSIRTSLGAGGRDLSLAEQIEFWTLVDTTTMGRRRNPTLVLDVGEISENTLAFAPETLYVRPGGGAAPDSVFGGKRPEGLDSLNTERDPFTRAFDAAKNDIGLPGDKADSIVVSDASSGAPRLRRERDVAICHGTRRTARALGDLRAACTVRNGRLDEEDIDLDGTLNFNRQSRESERLLRYVIDLSDTSSYVRVGKPATLVDTVDGRPTTVTKHWVLVRVPFGAPDEQIGVPQLRRMRGVRVTMISGQDLGDRDPSSIAIARMRFVAAPWVKRGEGPVSGVAGEKREGSGFTIVSLIGTSDRDPTRGLIYEPPPGVSDQPETIGGEQLGATQINERSLRILAGGLEPFQRAEAFHRFSAGQQNFMGYRELRLWARGHGAWSTSGEMQFFVRLGRDEHNFYLYRTPVNTGTTQSAWLPEIRVDFSKLQSLREQMERSRLGQGVDSLACTGVDSALIAASGLPLGGAPRRRAVCDDGYMVYSVEPGVTPPNLAAIQELAVGMFRLPSSGSVPVLPGDTLELWVDDIRLARAVDDVGTAGHLSVDLVAADVAALRLAYTRRGANFRQLGESPTFVDEGALDVTTTVRLEKLLPRGMQLTLPLTVTHTQIADDPVFLSRTDVRARGVEGLRTPRTGVTTWHLAARRATPITHSWLGPILNNLVLSSTYVAGGTRSEYQDGRTRQLTFGVDYVVAGAPRAVRLFGDNAFRWNPTQLRVTSALASGSDARDHFFQPAPSFDDVARRTEADTRVWRTGTTLEFRPTEAVTARWDLFSLRDLRNYDALDPSSQLADAAGGQLGFERERTMQVLFGIAPKVREWLRPRVDVTTAYGMLRDPNARSFVIPAAASRTDSIHQEALVGSDSRTTLYELQPRTELPRRLTASQSATAGLQLDVARALGARDSTAGSIRRLVRGFAPMDFTYSRSLLSAFDDASFEPPLGFQLALLGTGGFRRVRGNPATAAGITETMAAQTSLALPFGTTIANRFRRIENTSWTTRIDATQVAVDGVQTFFPDATLRWSWRPTARVTSPLVTGATTSIGYTASAARVTLPGLGVIADAFSEPASFRTTRVRTLPINASVTWGLGQLSTAAGLTRTERTDSLPGSIARGTSTEMTADAGRAFRIPQSWGLGLRNEVRARLTWQESRARTVVDDVLGRTQGRLADNGRRAITLNADTDVSETLLFTLQGSRVLTTDRNLDRRISQLVLSAVMQIQFYGGRAGAGGGG
jgi:hypothetical protein